MKLEEIIETQVNIVTVIAKTTDEIIPVIIANPELDENLKATIEQVFRFLSKIISMLPDMLITNKKQANHKVELLNTIDRICNSIGTLPNHPELLNDAWFEFNYWWNDFNKKIKELVESERTIYLSMN